MTRSKRSNGNKASNIETQNNAPTSSSDQQTQASSLALNSMDSQQHSKEELMSIIQIQDQKIQNLTNRLNNLSMNGKVMHFYRNAPVNYLREKLITSNSTPDDRLKQY